MRALMSWRVRGVRRSDAAAVVEVPCLDAVAACPDDSRLRRCAAFVQSASASHRTDAALRTDDERFSPTSRGEPNLAP